MKQKVLRLRLIWYLVFASSGVVGGGGAAGYWWWRAHSAKVDHQTIAFIASTSGSVSVYMRSIRDAIELFSKTYNVPVKRYTSDSTGESVLRILKQIYDDGIRKVIGPLTSQELNEAGQQFIAQHPDMVVITPSATSPKIASKIKMPNFFRFVVADDNLVAAYVQLLPVRFDQLDQILILAREDAWGKALAEVAHVKWSNALPKVKIKTFFYKTPENFESKDHFTRALAEVIQAMRVVLQRSNQRTVIVLFTFAELTDYVYLIYKDPLFKIPCFGSDAIAYSAVLPDNPLVAQFLIDINFEALAYLGNNTFSTKRLAVTENLFAQQKKTLLPIIIPSLYAFMAYDAMRCLSLCATALDVRKVLADFYGASGYIEVDQSGNRSTGTYMGIGLVASDVNKYRWVPLSLTRQEVFLTRYGVIERIATDLARKYTITWDEQLEVNIGAISLDLTNITALFRPSRNWLDAVITEYILLRYTQDGIVRRFVIFPALDKDGTQMYMNIDTKDTWLKKTSENLYIAPNDDHPVLKQSKSAPSVGRVV